MTTILILGGYGASGTLLAKHLDARTGAQLILAGRSFEKASALAARMGDPRVTTRRADAADPASMKTALEGVDLCLVASNTTRHTATVVQACLDAGADYLDIQFSNAKLKALYEAEEAIRKAGLCFITEAGYHPGLPAAMVRFAAGQMDSLGSALTAGYLNIGPDTPYTEAVDELMGAFIDYDARVYRGGAWTRPGKWSSAKFDFGGRIGKRDAYSMYFEELRCLPELYPSLKDLGFYISGSNWIADLLVTPIVMVGLKLAPQRGLRPLGKLMWWAMRQSRPPYEVQIAVEAHGLKDGRPVTVRASVGHPDGYELTAIPVAACLMQYLDGAARRPGLHMMGQIVEPVQFFRDMESMGAEVNERVD